MIIKLFSVLTRSAVYEMHFVPLRAVFFISTPRKDIDSVPLSVVFLVLGCTCSTNVVMAWACMAW